MSFLSEAIEANRKRHIGYKSDDRILQKIRLRYFDYQDAGKTEQSERIILRLKERLKPYYDAHRANRKAALLAGNR